MLVEMMVASKAVLMVVLKVAQKGKKKVEMRAALSAVMRVVLKAEY